MGTSEKEILLVFLVKSQHVGFVLGRGGENVNEIKALSAAAISFDKKGDASDAMMGERKARVQGSVQSVAFACFLMAGVAAHFGGASPQASMVLTTGACGPLVGKAGSHLKELRAATSTRVALEAQPHPALGGRQCTISGETLGNVFHAVVAILQMEAFSSPTDRPGSVKMAPQQTLFEAAIPRPAPAMQRPKPPAPVKMLSQQLGGYDAFSGAHQYREGMAAQMLSAPRPAPQGPGMGAPAAKRQRTGADMQAAVAGLHMELPAAGIPLGDGIDNSVVEVNLLLPSEHAGQVIGKGGANLALLRTNTGAKLAIDREEIFAGLRRAVVAGPLSSALKACFLVACLMRDLTGTPILDMVVSNNCGGIVGKGGSGLRRLREQHQCKVTLEADPAAGDGRRLTIMGSEPAGVAGCCYDALRLLVEQPHAQAQ